MNKYKSILTNIPAKPILCYDFTNQISYSGSGTVVTDIFSGSNSSLINSPTYSAFTSGSMYFDGTNDYLITTTSLNNFFSGTSPNKSEITSVFMWVYPMDNGVILSEQGTSPTPNTAWFDSQIEMVSGTLKFGMWNGSGISTITSSISTPLDNWYYIGMVYNGTTLTAYVNGLSAGTTTFNRAAPYNNGTNLYYAIASNCPTSMGDGTYSKMYLSRFEVFNYALTQSQINYNYNMTNGLFYDVDALAFLTTAGITDNTQKSAINRLVLDLKSYNIWTKMKAIYPFVGGTSTTHSYNLRNTAQYQITWNGGVTHSNTGVLSNNINGYGNTGLNPSTVLSLNSTHLSYYSRTNTSGNEDVEIGVSLSPNKRLIIAPKFFGDTSAYRAVNDSQVGPGTSPSDTRGFFIASRITSTQTKLYQNTSTLFTDNITSGDLANANIFVLVYNTGALPPVHYSTRECAFASIGDGLDDTESANLYTAVQTFQTTLGRQV